MAGGRAVKLGEFLRNLKRDAAFAQTKKHEKMAVSAGTRNILRKQAFEIHQVILGFVASLASPSSLW